jgi:Questin oxidase-like
MLHGMAGALGWAACGDALSAPSSPAPSSASPASGPRAPDDDALDEALRRLHAREPSSTQGLSTHAPMAAEALCALGHADRVSRWLDGYRGPTLELPGRTARIDPRSPQSWRAALGPDVHASSWERANRRWRDWVDLFVAELAAAPWRDVLDTWAARLAPGMSGGATHGVIRASHAVRALAHRDTPERRAELARGLAYWASSYEEVRGPRGRGPRIDLDALPLYRDTKGRAPTGRNIVEALRHLGELDGFPPPPPPPATAADLAAELSTLTAAFSLAYLRHGTRHDTIAFIHAVTGPCSLRRMAPHLRPETARAALPYAWQAAAALYATYARRADPRPSQLSGPPAATRPAPSRAALLARAIDHDDEHAIKLTETLLGEHVLAPDPVYLAAADDVLTRL